VGLATGLVVALFPFAAIGRRLLAAMTGGGAIRGAVAGHAAAGMSRQDLKELGGTSMRARPASSPWAFLTWAPRSKHQMKKTKKVDTKELKADTAQNRGRREIHQRMRAPV
jgi:hypothetical protein